MSCVTTVALLALLMLMLSTLIHHTAFIQVLYTATIHLLDETMM